MGLSKPNKRVFDPIRSRFVAATPEEIVRQTLLHKMLTELEFPKGLLAVEQELRLLPHLEGGKGEVPERRLDLLCVAPGIHPAFPLHPLLLVECKREGMGIQPFSQVMGYNHFVRAPFVAVASQDAVRLCRWDASEVFSTLLPYPELLRLARRFS